MANKNTGRGRSGDTRNSQYYGDGGYQQDYDPNGQAQD